MIRILYVHPNHSAYANNSLLQAISGFLRPFGQVRESILNNAGSFARIDLLVVETTIDDVLPAFMAGRAYEAKIPVVQLYDRPGYSVHPNLIPDAAHVAYSNAADLHNQLEGFFQHFPDAT